MEESDRLVKKTFTVIELLFCLKFIINRELRRYSISNSAQSLFFHYIKLLDIEAPVLRDWFIISFSIFFSKVDKSFVHNSGDVIVLGKTNLFRFNHPQEAAELREKRKVKERFLKKMQFCFPRVKFCGS